MKHALSYGAVCLLAVTLAACEKKREEDATATTGRATPAEPVAVNDKAGTPTTEPAAQRMVADEDIPTESDFEEQAEQTITAQNMEQQLDELEKEIAE